jgi:hypothetical protein
MMSMVMSPVAVQPPSKSQPDLRLMLPQGTATNTGCDEQVMLTSAGDANMRGGGGAAGGGSSEAAAVTLMWQQHAALLATQLEMARQQLAVTQQQLAQAQAAAQHVPASDKGGMTTSSSALAVVPATVDAGALCEAGVAL